MSTNSSAAFTFGTIADLIAIARRPNEIESETGQGSEPHQPQPPPQEPQPTDPEPLPDFRDVPPMSPVA